MTQSPIRPIPLTLGGLPDVNDILGRDQSASDVEKLLLGGQSVLLTGDRRTGKTCFSRVVEHGLRRRGHPVVRVSAERASFGDFVDALSREIEKEFQLTSELQRWEPTVKAGPFEARRRAPIVGLDQLLTKISERGTNKRVVVIIDEVPILARAMEQEKPGAGAAVLDTLRRVRQEHGSGLSMLLLGSIGFHHIAKSSPGSLNDITKEHVGPLVEADGVYLARCLMAGDSVNAIDPKAFAVAVHKAAEGIPYYIHHLVRDTRNHIGVHGFAATSLPAQLVDEALHHVDDPWNLRHYRDRVPEYYPDREELAYSVLDIFAGATGALGVDDVMRLLASTPHAAETSRRGLIDLIELLEQDHYLRREGKANSFRSEIVRRAWMATWR